MRVKATPAAIVAAGLLVTVGACQGDDVQTVCAWELEAYSKPKPPKANVVKPGKAPVKMPTAKATRKPVKMPTRPAKPSSRAPKGKHWEYDCD
jgi:hypothetical protein